MTSSSPDPDPTDAARQDVSGAVTATLVRFVRSRAGDDGVAQMLDLAGERRPTSVIEDPTAWNTHDEAVALFAAGGRVTGDPAIGLHVGEEMLRQHDGTEIANRLRSLGSPGALLENVTAAAAKFNTVSIMDALEVGDAHAVVRALTRPGFVRDPLLCDFTRGLLTQVPVLFGLVPAMVTESECQARGGRFCLYSVAWEDRQWSAFVDERTSLYTAAWTDEAVVEAEPELELDADTRIAQLTEQLRQMGERLDGVFSTAAELLVDEDISTLLARITSRAAQAVNAPQHLLVVRTAPDAPVQLHHHGFNQAEAQVLATELWRANPDDAGGSRLIVDIASSRRRYGRLAAVFPPGVRFLESERQILRLYAAYAATALDVVTSLEDARRSDATARGLLEFTRAMAQVSSIDDVAQVLADSVPEAVRAADATVLTWGADDETLSVQARTSSDRGRAARMGGAAAGGVGIEEPLTVRRSETELIDRLLSGEGVLVVDATTSDTLAKELFSRFGGTAAVIAPLFSGADFLGAVVATYRTETAAALGRDRDLQARLMGLADQAAIGFQNAQLHDRISHMAWHDDLTGLPNRRLLEDRVNTELERFRRHGEGVSIFFVDLDRLKAVNDSLGHAAGDELIRQVASRLSETVRRQDTVARLAGDEFAVLLPGLSDTGSIDHLARRSLEALSAPYTIQGREVRSSASIGVAFTPTHGVTFDELLNRADEAMYRSKTLGRNRFHVYDGAIEDGTAGGLHLDSEIPGALERGEFFILFQPVVDLSTTRVTGVEALVRWRHPTRGVLEPSAFIPAAEESDVIVTLDTWVLRESCSQVRRWRERGLPPLRLCVNVASRDLAHPAVVDTVRSVLADGAIDPSMLEFEITERVVLDAAGIAERHVRELGELGVRFAIDDFGAGNSSMNRIGTLPVSTLKIDPSFVHVLGPESESSALVSAIITMAQRLGLESVAEGVETPEQSRVLIQRGCQSAQGFHFCPPLLPDDIERLLMDGPDLGDPGELAGAAS